MKKSRFTDSQIMDALMRAEAASKLIWLALRNITADRTRSTYDWKLAMNQFAIMYQERFHNVIR